MKYLAFVLACLATISCGDEDQSTSQSQIVNVITNPVSPTSPTPEPSGDEVAAVLVTAFGVEVGPNPIPGASLRVGNTQPVTCTPKLADGTDAPPEVHGPAPDFFGPILGAGNARVESTFNPFNLDIVGQAGGVFSLQCIVNGVQGQLSMLVVP